MNEMRKIIYFGQDVSFFEELQDLVPKSIKGAFELRAFSPAESTLVESVCSFRPNIVFVDLTNLDFGKVISSIRHIKSSSFYKKVLFVTIAPDSENFKILRHSFVAGASYGHIKGEELKLAVKDSLYIGLGERPIFPQYARAKKILKELPVYFGGSISKICPEDFVVETDIEIFADRLPVNFELFDIDTVDSFKIVSHSSSSLLCPMFESYLLEFPVASPWEEVSEDTIGQETVGTWFSHNTDQLLTSKPHFIFFSTDHELMNELLLNIDSRACDPHFCSNKDLSQRLYSIEVNRPALIFYDFSVSSVDAEFENIAKLIKHIVGQDDYRPILIFSGCPSTGPALTKVYGYNNIVSLPNPLTLKVAELFMSKYLDKISESSSSKYLVFPDMDLRRSVDIVSEVLITSLTEHEITFLYKGELPMFSVFRLSLPVNCFVTIIPPYFDLGTSPKGKHYMGFIHTISESERSDLRKFVNQIIYKPIEDFSAEEVTRVMNRIEPKPEEVLASQVEEEVTEAKPATKDFIRPAVSGKSKL